VERILPRPTPLSQHYWDGCRQGELRLQQCTACDRYQFYPRIFCSHCGHAELGWQVASGRGVLASFTVVQRGITAAYPAPYIVALVDLAEGPRMMSTVVDQPADTLWVGAPVEVAFVEWSADFILPVFRLAGETGGEQK
jgi:uncharacterized OB-fold protein